MHFSSKRAKMNSREGKGHFCHNLLGFLMRITNKAIKTKENHFRNRKCLEFIKIKKKSLNSQRNGRFDEGELCGGVITSNFFEQFRFVDFTFM